MGIIKRWVLIGSVSLLVLSCGKDDPAATAINGTVAAGTGNCGSGAVQVSVYSGNSVQKQSSVNPGSTFSFPITPGTYSIGAQNPSGCGSLQSVTVTEGQATNVTLTLQQGAQYAPTGVQQQYPNGQYPNTYPSPYPSSYPNGYYPNGQYPNGQYPNGQYPNTYPSPYPNQQYPQGQYPGYPPNYYPPFYSGGYNPFMGAPTVTYPYIYMNGLGGNGFYYWNYNSYAGPCRYGQAGGWICSNTF